MELDERALRADIAKPGFRLAIDEGRWRVMEITWPHVVVAVTALDGMDCVLRLNCAGYPRDPPTGGPWDVEKNSILAADLWPKGKSPNGRVRSVFRSDWKAGAALYLPCDRTSLEGHPDWPTKLPSQIWAPSVGLSHYLELVHELLHCSDYAPAVRAAP